MWKYSVRSTRSGNSPQKRHSIIVASETFPSSFQQHIIAQINCNLKPFIFTANYSTCLQDLFHIVNATMRPMKMNTVSVEAGCITVYQWFQFDPKEEESALLLVECVILTAIRGV